MSQNFQQVRTSLETITNRVQNSLMEPERIIQPDQTFNRRATLLIGPRGTGKTTFLLRNLEMNNAFYLSLDNPLIAGLNFYEFGDYLFQNGIDTLICDEVHFLENWSVHLKALYDAHPRNKIIATDSSSLILRKGIGDLSRRFVVEHMSYLSFREYLYLKHKTLLPGLTWAQLTSTLLTKQIKPYQQTPFNIQKEFKLYLENGTRPYFLEGDSKSKTLNTIDKIIYNDIPYFLPEVKERHLHLMKNIIGYIATSPIPVLNIDSLSQNWSVAKATVYNLLEVMTQSGLLRIIPEEGKKGKTKGKKIFFGEPNIYSALDGNLGNIRECFFSMAVESIGLQVSCPKDDSIGDYIIDGSLFEIGGKNKKSKGADFLVKDNIDSPAKNTLPLWLFGFLVK